MKRSKKDVNIAFCFVMSAFQNYFVLFGSK